VRALPNLRFLDRCDIVGRAATPDSRRITGVRMLRRADGSAEELLGADLVVDATGRGSRTPIWLQALGYPRPDQEQVRVGLGYATRTYRLPPDTLDGDLPSRWTTRFPSASRPASGTATNGWTASPTACWWWGMRCAASTRSTARA
jgi:hypothetical protein